MIPVPRRRGRPVQCRFAVAWFVIPAETMDTPSRNRRRAMIRWFFRQQIAAFERIWNYDASYVHELIDTDPRAFMALGKVMGLGRYRKDVPAAAFHAAGIIAVMAEDCGPCTQLAIDMAEREGIDPAILRAVAARDFAAMPFEVA